MQKYIKDKIQEYNNKRLGIAFLYPRKQQISFNGFRVMNIKEGLKYINESLQAFNHNTQ